MTDVLAAALRAVAAGAPVAYPLVFVAGVVTSAGPCTAPRYIAVAALAHGRRPWRTVAAFASGLVGAYVLAGLVLTSLATLWSSSRWLYATLAIALAAGGAHVLFRGESDACVARRADTRSRASLGGTFLLGASSALVVSPCCTPTIAAIAGLTAVSGRTLDAILLLAAFGCGHALPLVVAGALGRAGAGAFARVRGSHATATISGALMLGLAAYYGVLA